MAGGLQDPNVARRLASGNAELTRHLKQEFGKAAQQVADEAQRKILAAHSAHPGPLRAEIAATVSARGRKTLSGFSAEIKSDGALMPAGKQNLPAYANAGAARWRRWRHPVYQTARNPDTWVTQEWPSAQGWLDDTVRAETGTFTGAVQAAIDQAQAYLEGR